MKKCPICKSQHIDSYITVKQWQINICLNCDVLYTELQGNKRKKLNDFYDNGYIASYKSREKELKGRFRQYLEIIEKYKSGGKLLDIGCGLGYFISVAEESKETNWKTAGIEPNKNLISSADKNIQIKIVNSSMASLPFAKDTFDCITCFDVLEHDVNLQRNLMEIKRVLKKDGILIIQAPNYKSLMALLTGSLWDWWAPPDHVLHFSFTFLINYLENHDFTVINKFTYERPKDFLSNIKGRMSKNYLAKATFYLAKPILLLIERVGGICNLGGLSFVVVKKN